MVERIKILLPRQANSQVVPLIWVQHQAPAPPPVPLAGCLALSIFAHSLLGGAVAAKCQNS